MDLISEDLNQSSSKARRLAGNECELNSWRRCAGSSLFLSRVSV